MKLDIGAFFLLGVILALSHNNILYAHNFCQNDNPVLYTLIKQFDIEKNPASKNQLSNNSSFSIHSKRAVEFFHQLASIRNDVTENSNFSFHYNDTFSEVNLTTKALVSDNMADEVLREYGLPVGPDPEMASGLLSMSVDMIMKMSEMSTMNMTDSTDNHDMEKMSSMRENQSSTELSQGSNVIKNLANYETSVELAKSLKTLFTNYLQ